MKHHSQENKVVSLNKSLEIEEEKYKPLSNTIGSYTIGNNIFKISGKTLGEGTFGKVKLGTHKVTNEKVKFITN